MESYVIFLIGFGLICAIVSHCVRVGKDSMQNQIIPIIQAKNAKYNSSGKIVAYGDFSRDYVSHNSYGYIIKNENKFKYLIDDLCRLAALDGIKVEKIVAKDSRTGLKYDFPSETLSGFMLDYCNLVVKCSCTIPQSTFDE